MQSTNGRVSMLNLFKHIEVDWFKLTNGGEDGQRKEASLNIIPVDRKILDIEIEIFPLVILN